MRLVFTETGWGDYSYWLETDRATIKRINRLLSDILRSPYSGLGKPELLKHSYAGSWSRRITEEHRLVYVIDGNDVVVYQARYHY